MKAKSSKPFVERDRVARAAIALPALHADPLDRMLVAQAREKVLTSVRVDPLRKRYDVVSL